ncbi:hypothetical protein TRVA0_007S02102 [Trichomonascus vanleenenianus]|uniref:ABC1 kinase family protein n=1 Tax=Trichomonascus vanleenenianus TaxID=2268995 RepID=UPI003ECB52DC
MFNASAFARSLRCVYDLAFVGLDYKLNFKEGRDIEALHERSADRIYRLMITNKGLYIKMGQAVAIQAGVLPQVYQEKLAKLFDSAPQDTWAKVEQLLTAELGEPPDQYFEYIDHHAVASASIAQVHQARLKTGEIVAVKVQHADISKQVYWDLLAYKSLMYIYDRFLFKIPIYFIAEHVADRLTREIDFCIEVANSNAMKAKVECDRELSRDIYVPWVYDQLSTGRVIVSEWIDGITLNKKKAVLFEGYNVQKAMTQIMKLYGRQIFDWGIVHCDPHPGNIFIRKHNGRQQVVLIDHGLYITETDEFRQDYCRFWDSMFTGNTEQLKEIAAKWGFGNGEMLATATMMRRYNSSSSKQGESNTDTFNAHEEFEVHQQAREQFRSFLQDTTRIPLELIFLGRTIRIIQGLNRMYGSPVNRLKILATESSRAWKMMNPPRGVMARLSAVQSSVTFWLIMLVSDVAFFLIRLKQFLLGGRSKGVEDILEERMEEMGYTSVDPDSELVE